MTVRNPTAFTGHYDFGKYSAGSPILAASLSDIIDDQVFHLDKSCLTLTDARGIQSTSSGAFVLLARYYVRGKDMCDVAGVTNNEISHEATVLASVNAGAAEVRITSTAVASNVTTFTVTSTVPVWAAYQALNIKTNGIEDELILEARVTTASTLAVGGIGIFALET